MNSTQVVEHASEFDNLSQPILQDDPFREPLLKQQEEVFSDDEDEDEEFEHQHLQGTQNQHQTKTTNIQTFLHLIKGNIGPSCLSLPWAFSQLGLLMGFIVTLLLASLTAYNSLSVVSMKERLHTHHPLNVLNVERRPYSLGDLSERAYGKKFRIFVIVCLCIQQLSICTLFISFIGDNLSAVAHSLTQTEDSDNEKGYNYIMRISKSFDNSSSVILAVGPILLSLSCFPNLKTLVPISLIGTISLYLGLGLLSIVCVFQWQSHNNTMITLHDALFFVPSWKNFPLAVSSILYSLERTNLVLAIQSSMKTPEHFVRVYASSMLLIVLTITIFCSFCVLTFGNLDNGSIFTHLLIKAKKKSDDWDVGQNINLVIAADIIYCISVLFSYPHQLFPCITILSQVRLGNFIEYNDRNSSLHDELVMNQPSASVLTIPIYRSSEDLQLYENKYHDAFFNDDVYVSFDEKPKEQLPMSIPISVRSQIEGDSAFMRAILVLLTFLVALFFLKGIGQWNSILFVAVFAGTIMTLIVPPLIELSLVSRNHRMQNPLNYGDFHGHDETHQIRIRCYALIFIGFLLGMLGTIASLREIHSVYEPNAIFKQ